MGLELEPRGGPEVWRGRGAPATSPRSLGRFRAPQESPRNVGLVTCLKRTDGYVPARCSPATLDRFWSSPRWRSRCSLVLPVSPLATLQPTPVPARSAHVHPDFPVRPSPEMIANSELAAEIAASRGRCGGSGVCGRQGSLAQDLERELSDPSRLPVEGAGTPELRGRAPARYWAELQGDADSLVGQTLDVKGTLGLVLSQGTNSEDKCAPDTCLSHAAHGLQNRRRAHFTPARRPIVCGRRFEAVLQRPPPMVSW